MTVTSFKETSLGWRIELFRQRLQEWWELQLSRIEINTPELSGLDSDLIQLAIKVILWSFIATIAVWLTWQIWLLLHPLIRYWQRQQRQRQSSSKNPLEPQLSPQNWLSEAQRYYQQQNYHQGIVCLYQGILQYLSDREIITRLASRTDAEYLNLIQQRQLGQFLSYQLLFLTHEQLCFSNLPASASLFKKCQEAYQIIMQKN
ncbi:MAG TPA: DUF4129 domain-containing protein [Xenococcaceae cyanobacterium]